jgi:phage shock protein PspC (stress-responsive transcriptional regulator)
MKPVEKVSIGRMAFTVEDDAYSTIKKYLDDLNEFYSKSASGAEIMEGIEGRMAELLSEQAGKDGIVTKIMADNVISVLGDPEQIENESGESGDADTEGTAGQPSANATHKLYRDPTNKIIGGVCGGLGAYFHFDPLWLRLGLAALTILLFAVIPDHADTWWPWTPIIAYILLWICVPQANTVHKRCEMKGEGSTVNDIKDQVMNDSYNTAATQNANQFWKVLGRIIVIIIGIMLFLIGIAGVAAIIVAIFGIDILGWVAAGSFSGDWISSFYNVFPMLGSMPTLLVTIPLFLALFMPFLGMLYGGLQMMFNFKTPKWRPGLWMLILWAASVIMLVVVLGIAAIPAL